MTWLRDTRPMTTLRATRRPRSCAATHDHAVSRTRLVRHGATSPRSMPGGRASRAAGSAPARPVNLGPFIAARWAHHVLIAGQAGAVDAEVEPGVGEAQVLVEAVGGRIAVPACLAIVGPVADRAGATPGSIAAAGTSRRCLLTHAGKPSTSIIEATGLPGGQDLALLWGPARRGTRRLPGREGHQPIAATGSTDTLRNQSQLEHAPQQMPADPQNAAAPPADTSGWPTPARFTRVGAHRGQDTWPRGARWTRAALPGRPRRPAPHPLRRPLVAACEQAGLGQYREATSSWRHTAAVRHDHDVRTVRVYRTGGTSVGLGKARREATAAAHGYP